MKTIRFALWLVLMGLTAGFLFVANGLHALADRFEERS
jgi:hypothetical protein